LGGWQDEKPDEVIESVTVLSPKNYMLKIANKEDLETKSKGVVLHMKNKQKVNQGVLNEMLASKVSMFEGRERVQELMMDNFNIFPNSTIASLPFAQLCSRYNEKRMRSVLTKRQIVQVFNKDEEGDVVEVEMGVNLKRIRLLPFGHEAFEELSEKELSDLYYQFK
jgi:succinate dehydrogenase/fumarate reductase flavoprotein subunit